TQGTTFDDRYGETLAELVERLMGTESTVDPDADAGKTESTAWLRLARHKKAPTPERSTNATVLASGNLGLVYLPGEPRRLYYEEIEARHPGLIDGLRQHPGVGFLLVRSQTCGSLVL